MFCSKCGVKIQDGYDHCTSCGAKIDPGQQPQQQPGQQYQTQPENNQENPYQWQQNNNQAFAPVPQEYIADGESKSKSSLVMGILSIALCWVFGIPGIILGALAISNGKKARQALNESHYYFWNALAGIITGGIGLGLSIFFTIYEFIAIILVAVIASS